MTDKLAIWLGAAIVLAIIGDIGLNGGAGLVFLLQKLAVFIEFLSFWR
jgi:hypothetical protein